jgi:phosphatidylserine/phosphatidylglycerophosphate/cardiolipin synthase-like enzyme
MKKISITFPVLLILSLACNSLSGTRTPPTSGTADSGTDESPRLTNVQLPAGYGVKSSWFELYFTDPSSPVATQKTGGVDGPMTEAIDAAKLSVDVAIYSLSLNSVRDALLRAHDRGVQVRVVMESDNLDRADPQRLKEAGIPILGDRRQGLMHDKFVVIDGSEVWMGSMNFTDSGAYEDNNNLMRIRSVKMAENYIKEFEEMFIDDKFGEDVVVETPNPRVTIDGTPIDVYFSPDDRVQQSFVELVENAEKSITFMAFSFTADEIGDAVRARALDGVEVQGVMETEQVNSNVGTEFDLFQQAGLDVLRDGIEGQMHHKVMVIDESIVIFGSYNFTNNAEDRNDENLLVVYNTDIAAQFTAELQRVYAETQ